MHRLAIFASGSGTNAEEIFKYFKDNHQIKVVLLVSNNPQGYALERAKRFGISTQVFNRQQWKEQQVVLDWLKEFRVTHVVLAGFMWLVPSYLINAFPNKIINIHPALLPKFGGKGLYGMNVHEAVRLANEKETGITIHLVNEKYDDGKILFQASCPVSEHDTADDIAGKVHQLEYLHYPEMIEKWILNALIK